MASTSDVAAAALCKEGMGFLSSRLTLAAGWSWLRRWPAGRRRERKTSQRWGTGAWRGEQGLAGCGRDVMDRETVATPPDCAFLSAPPDGIPTWESQQEVFPGWPGGGRVPICVCGLW